MSLRQIQTLVSGLDSTEAGKAASKSVIPLKGPDRRPAMLALRDGLNQVKAGDLALATENFQKAEILYMQTGDKRSASLTRTIVGLCLESIGEPEKCRKAYEKAIRLLEISEMPDAVGRLLILLARYEQRAGDNRRTVSALQRALMVFRQTGQAAGLAEALCQYAEHELSRGRRSEAKGHCQKAREVLDRIEDVNTYEKLRDRVDRVLAA